MMAPFSTSRLSRNAEHITDGVAYTVSRAAYLERTSHED
jgi:hypothetical protein